MTGLQNLRQPFPVRGFMGIIMTEEEKLMNLIESSNFIYRSKCWPLSNEKVNWMRPSGRSGSVVFKLCKFLRFSVAYDGYASASSEWFAGHRSTLHARPRGGRDKEEVWIFFSLNHLGFHHRYLVAAQLYEDIHMFLRFGDFPKTHKIFSKLEVCPNSLCHENKCKRWLIRSFRVSKNILCISDVVQWEGLNSILLVYTTDGHSLRASAEPDTLLMRCIILCTGFCRLFFFEFLFLYIVYKW